MSHHETHENKAQLFCGHPTEFTIYPIYASSLTLVSCNCNSVSVFLVFHGSVSVDRVAIEERKTIYSKSKRQKVARIVVERRSGRQGPDLDPESTQSCLITCS